jgi:hypothetical protein
MNAIMTKSRKRRDFELKCGKWMVKAKNANIKPACDEACKNPEYRTPKERKRLDDGFTSTFGVPCSLLDIRIPPQHINKKAPRGELLILK